MRLKQWASAAAFVVLIAPWSAYGATCVFSWDAPTTNTDGSPLTDLAGYRLYSADTAGGQTLGSNWDGETDASKTQLELECFEDKYWVATAYDSSNNESGPSNEIFVNATKPAAPGGMTVTITVTVTMAPVAESP